MAFPRNTTKEKIYFIIGLSLYQQHTLAGSRTSKHGRARDLRQKPAPTYGAATLQLRNRRCWVLNVSCSTA